LRQISIKNFLFLFLGIPNQLTNKTKNPAMTTKVPQIVVGMYQACGPSKSTEEVKNVKKVPQKFDCFGILTNIWSEKRSKMSSS
jgi:hypothetical protein